MNVLNPECYPVSILPQVTRLYRDYLAMNENAPAEPVRRWYGFGKSGGPFSRQWMLACVPAVNSARLADELKRQNESYGASPAAMANIEKLRQGARAVVTGQQVVLMGGPLLTLLKAATTVARAKEATEVGGIDHVPVFWMATEDHDLVEVDQLALLNGNTIETLRAGLRVHHAVPVGGVSLCCREIEPLLDRVAGILDHAPVTEWLRECYLPQGKTTMAAAFGRLMARIFADQGLVLIDASTREFHAQGAQTLRYAIEHADELQSALIARSSELVRANYHAQVLVSEGASVLFLLEEHTGERIALRRTADGQWRAGGDIFTSEDLLAILDKSPERLSPNALLRPVFQDTLLPAAAYIGGPAEVAYFAQSAVLYERILGRITPVLPRLSATLIEPAIASVMDRDEIRFTDALTTADNLAQQLGAKSMPAALKRKLAAVTGALDTELSALTEYLSGIEPNLGASARTSGSKMLYQMNRLRRMAATHELQKQTSLRRHAEAITNNIFPDGHPQERLLAGVWFLARYGVGLIERLVEAAGNRCPGHVIVRL
ncbi:MAG: bacillithiol biosynthesis cysteine-adding enzyme BshC [Acidobacteriaceae bacterium]|nr:bacillithiol biosynthesis cysteine-adding enzyme BshC [Acidobacteriaceae bacterium]